MFGHELDNDFWSLIDFFLFLREVFLNFFSEYFNIT